MRRRYFLLLELLIGLALAAVLMGYLFQEQKQLFSLRRRIDQTKDHVLAKTRVFLRLDKLLSNLEKCQFEEGKLTVVHHHNLDPDPNFCGTLTSTLYRDRDRLLLMTTGERGGMRTETLLENVEHFSCRFFQDKEWSGSIADKKKLPQKIKVIVKVNQETVEYPYWVHRS